MICVLQAMFVQRSCVLRGNLCAALMCAGGNVCAALMCAAVQGSLYTPRHCHSIPTSTSPLTRLMPSASCTPYITQVQYSAVGKSGLGESQGALAAAEGEALDKASAGGEAMVRQLAGTNVAMDEALAAARIQLFQVRA